MTDNLIVRGQFFETSKHARFTAIECSDFALLARWANSEDIKPVLAQRADCGFNMLRMWTAFDGIPGIGTFTTLDYGVLPEFVALCAHYGLYVEFTAYTGWNDPAHWNRLCQAALRCTPSALLELVNEFDQNTGEPDQVWAGVRRLAVQGGAASIAVVTREQWRPEQIPVRPPWSYETFHTNDAFEWWRKTGHNAMEMAAGAEGVPASGLPILSNENTRYTDRDTASPHAQDSAAGAALLCAGSCYHTVSGKAGLPWTSVEEAAARAWAAGARAVDLTFQDGAYRRVDDAAFLRVYQRVLPDGRAFTVQIRA